VARAGKSSFLLVNPASGNGQAHPDELAREAAERGITVHVLEPGETVGDVVAEAIAGDVEVLGVASGDGSLALAAAAAHEHDLAFVCVPAGTRNHFARDLGLDPSDPIGALDAFTDGVERRIDLGRVNGRVFVNNVSLGIYGEAVSKSTYRESKVRTLFETALEVLGSGTASPDLVLVDDEGNEHRDPAVVVVSNNPYGLEGLLEPGGRPALDTGELGVLLFDTPSGGSAPARAWTTTSLEIAAPASVNAGIDGEAVELDPPLAFEIMSAALRVRVPVPDG
jgi:diacylglycerol kinase family enzyme